MKENNMNINEKQCENLTNNKLSNIENDTLQVKKAEEIISKKYLKTAILFFLFNFFPLSFIYYVTGVLALEAEVKPLFYLISVFNIMLILLYLTIIFLQILNKKREYYRGLVLVKKGDFLGSLSIVCSNQNSKIKNIIAYKYTVMSDIEIKYDNYYTIIIKNTCFFRL